MKKKLVAVLCGITVFLMVGCGEQNQNEADSMIQIQGSIIQSSELQDDVNPGGTSSEGAAEKNAEENGTGKSSDPENDDNVTGSEEIYAGNWVEPIAQRGYMEIARIKDGEYQVQVNWGSSAFETAHWSFTANYDADTQSLIYEGGIYQTIEFDENGTEKVTLEKEVKGTLRYENGKLYWTDNAFEADEPYEFVNEERFTHALTSEQALEAVKKYCLINNPDLEGKADSEKYAVYWDVEANEANEIVVLYRSYTGSETRYYIDPVSGETYVTERVPGIIDEEQRTDESLNVRDYLDE